MSSLLRMMRYMRPYRWIVFWGIVTTVLPVLMELLVPRMLQYVIDKGIRGEDMDAIWLGSLVMLGGAAVGAVATLGQGLCRAHLSQGMAFDMRNDLFQHIQALPFATLDRLQTGGLMTRISSDVDIIRMFSSNGLSLLLRALLMIIGSVVIVVLTDWQLSIIMLVSLSVAGVLIWNFMRLASPLFEIVQEKLSALNTIVQENLAGARVVKAFVREPYEIERFAGRNDDYMAQNIQVGQIMSLVMPTLTVLTNVGLVAVIWFGGVDTINGRISVGELIAFNNYLMIGMTPLLMLGNILTMSSRAEASASRVLEIFNTPLLVQSDTAHRSDQMRGHIAFEDVTFRYETVLNGNGAVSDTNPAINNGSRNVLDHVSFQVNSGQRVALLGATGTGKSTLISLITRFYDVTGGRILVDGVDVREWDAETLRSQIGVVLQETILFSGTVHENIAYGAPNASRDDVVTAAKAAQAHDFIMAMPDGYDSIIEARGANLSGGQKQRIAIARALLIAPRILILDDSTSAVDLDTEIKIQDALEERLADTTTIIIAQRINSVLTADQIMVLDGGHITASGSHEELMQMSPIYQEIYQSQLGNGQHNDE
ncbi:MAG: ABC transporter ATP-binding protein [Anaerolineae bacterium]|nr:ABC transporter ATP-binding protein [Anaerolineae bacterium]